MLNFLAILAKKITDMSSSFEGPCTSQTESSKWSHKGGISVYIDVLIGKPARYRQVLSFVLINKVVIRFECL